MKTLAKYISTLSLAGLVLVLAGAWILVSGYSEEVLIIAPKADEIVELEKELWLPGDPVADIYGTPMDQPTLVVMPDQTKLIYPSEDDSLVLLKVDKQAGDNPLQAKTVWFVTRWAALALSMSAVLTFFAGFRLCRRRE